jgi:hypothetical protein
MPAAGVGGYSAVVGIVQSLCREKAPPPIAKVGDGWNTGD